MTNLCFAGFGRDERVAEDRSTWFTPPDLAWRMALWAGAVMPERILEPSAGNGNLVAAARHRWASASITACEVDPYYVDRLGERFAADKLVDVVAGDYRDFRAEAPFYDLGFANPPYEDGLDGQFLRTMMGQCERIIALVRLAALAGAGRREQIWSHVGNGWRLAGLAIFASRPEFQAGRAVGDRREGDSAKADFCVVKLARGAGDGRTEVEWW